MIIPYKSSNLEVFLEVYAQTCRPLAVELVSANPIGA